MQDNWIKNIKNKEYASSPQDWKDMKAMMAQQPTPPYKSITGYIIIGLLITSIALIVYLAYYNSDSNYLSENTTQLHNETTNQTSTPTYSDHSTENTALNEQTKSLNNNKIASNLSDSKLTMNNDIPPSNTEKENDFNEKSYSKTKEEEQKKANGKSDNRTQNNTTNYSSGQQVSSTSQPQSNEDSEQSINQASPESFSLSMPKNLGGSTSNHTNSESGLAKTTNDLGPDNGSKGMLDLLPNSNESRPNANALNRYLDSFAPIEINLTPLSIDRNLGAITIDTNKTKMITPSRRFLSFYTELESIFDGHNDGGGSLNYYALGIQYNITPSFALRLGYYDYIGHRRFGSYNFSSISSIGMEIDNEFNDDVKEHIKGLRLGAMKYFGRWFLGINASYEISTMDAQIINKIWINQSLTKDQSFAKEYDSSQYLRLGSILGFNIIQNKRINLGIHFRYTRATNDFIYNLKSIDPAINDFEIPDFWNSTNVKTFESWKTKTDYSSTLNKRYSLSLGLSFFYKMR